MQKASAFWRVCLEDFFGRTTIHSEKRPEVLGIAPLKTNMCPENRWLEDVFPTEIVPF